MNIAEKAHIYAFSSGGPRGNDEIDADGLNHFGNLMLVCHDCHRTIDKTIKNGGRYPAELLIAWKREHEDRIELAGAIAPDKQSHVLLYGAKIGLHQSPLQFQDAAEAMFPARYPADHHAIQLGMRNSAAEDREADYWVLEARNLASLFQRRVREPLADGLIGHLSIFALAPQPLLVLLGSLLIDIAAADVFQRRREPATWTWADEAEGLELIVRKPTELRGPPALVISLSATIDLDRIRAVNPDLTLWQVTIEKPHNDFLQTPGQLAKFRHTMRLLFDQIKARHGQGVLLSIFPAMPVACAVELGRIRMPKADLALLVYDQIPGEGFVPALNIPFEGVAASRGED